MKRADVGDSRRKLKSSSDFWDRGTFYNKKMADYDAIVVALPGNKFKASHHDIPNGVRLEILSAIKSRKKIFLAYRSFRGMAIYETDTANLETDYDLSGLGGTSHVIHQFIAEKNEEMKQKTSSVIVRNLCSGIELETVQDIHSEESYLVTEVEQDERLLLF